MKIWIITVVTALLFSCTKEPIGNSQRQLISLTINDALNESFEYNAGGKLVKENYYFFCTKPADEFMYSYTNNRLAKIESITRSMYSSTAAICGGAAGMHSVEMVEYDNLQRIKKIVRDSSSTTYTYNNLGLVERAEITGGGYTVFSTYTYDSRNNLVEESGSQGQGTTRYEFDNKINPYYQANSRPGIITAFNSSPNNVIKVIGASSGQVISYEYDAAGYPVKMFDPSGATYVFQYR